jgi:dihydrofolate reductase
VAITLICAVGNNREIGRGGDLVWRISEDLKRFKRITMGHPMVMGRKTFESIGCALPGRTSIVVTRQDGYEAKGCVVVGSIDEAIEVAGTCEGGEEVFVIGGGQLYQELIGRADKLQLTVIDAAADDADTWFPAYEDDFELSSEEGPFDQDGLSYRFKELSRKS